jgi:hypothetical protein
MCLTCPVASQPIAMTTRTGSSGQQDHRQAVEAEFGVRHGGESSRGTRKPRSWDAPGSRHRAACVDSYASVRPGVNNGLALTDLAEICLVAAG